MYFAIIMHIIHFYRYLEETRSTLQFASRAKLVTTHATVNEVFILILVMLPTSTILSLSLTNTCTYVYTHMNAYCIHYIYV